MDEEKLKSTIAIDFGSTNSAAYVCKNNTPTALACNDVSGEFQFPSFVEYTKSGAVVGLTAKRNFGKDKKYVVACVKRLLGKTYEEYLQIPDKTIFGCDVVRSSGGLPEFLVSSAEENIRKSCVEVASEIFKAIKGDADNFLDRNCEYAYLTYPVDYNDNQKEAIKQACNLAGLEVIGWIREPEAAAMSWCLHPDFRSEQFEKYIIFDFGGGTLDVSCLSCFRDQTKFSHSKGDAMLGGNDVDTCLVVGIQNEYKQLKGHDLIRTQNERRKWRKFQLLRALCEDMKRSLSSEISVTVDFTDIVDAGDVDDQVISRVDFERIINLIVRRCMEVVDKVTEVDGWSAGAIRHVILVGGSSRICIFRQCLQEKFMMARIPSFDVVNPYSCVAEGACRKMINDVYHTANASSVLESSYGISGGDQVMILLRKGIFTPCDSANIFVKTIDNSKKLVTTVYEYKGDINANQAKLLIPINQCFRKENIEFDISTTNSNIFEIHMHLEPGGIMRITCLNYYDKTSIGQKYINVG